MVIKLVRLIYIKLLLEKETIMIVEHPKASAHWQSEI